MDRRKKLLPLALVLMSFAISSVDMRAADMREAGERERRFFDFLKNSFKCKEFGDTCRGLPKCCGDLQCYFKGSFNPLTGGVCVQCVTKDLNCQRDKQCCEGLQCDKEAKMSVNGRCLPPRAEGATCHADSMCEGFCDKHWSDFYGKCKNSRGKNSPAAGNRGDT